PTLPPDLLLRGVRTGRPRTATPRCRLPGVSVRALMAPVYPGRSVLVPDHDGATMASAGRTHPIGGKREAFQLPDLPGKTRLLRPGSRVPEGHPLLVADHGEEGPIRGECEVLHLLPLELQGRDQRAGFGVMNADFATVTRTRDD